MAAADDLRLPATEDKRSVSVRLFNWYRPKLVACPDRQVGARLGEVTHLVRPMSSLFAPQVVSRVLVAAMERRIKAVGGRPHPMTFVRCHRVWNDRGDSGSDDLRQAERPAAADALQPTLRSGFRQQLKAGIKPQIP